MQCRLGKIILGGVGVGALIVAVVIHICQVAKETPRVFDAIHSPAFGDIFIAGRYEGLLNGWDVALLHCDSNGQWYGYYLAHESYGWGKARLQVLGDRVVVVKGREKVAYYDPESGNMLHMLRGYVYSREKASIEKKRLSYWGFNGSMWGTK